MSFVADWLNESLQAQTANMVVDDTLIYLKERDGLIDTISPLQTFTNRKFMTYVVKQIRTVASIIAPGAQIPATQQGSFERIIAEMFKMGLSYIYDEPTQWDMRDAISLAMARNVMVQNDYDINGELISRGENNDLAEMLFGSIAQMTQSFVDKLSALTWQALQYGQVTSNDSRTHVGWTLDYKDPKAAYNHFPSPLTGVNRWNQPTTANGINDLYRAVRTYIRTNGFKPDMSIFADELYQNLMMQDSTKQAASSMTVTQVGSVSPEMLLELFRRRGIPMPMIMDERYQEEDTAKNTYEVRFINDNRFIFAKQNMGIRALGPTLEASKDMGIQNDGMDTVEGIYIVTREIEKMPSVDATQGVAMGLPLFVRPKLFYSQQVQDPS